MSNINPDEILDTLEALVEQREHELNPDATDSKIYEMWCSYLSNFPKVSDMRDFRSRIDSIESYVEERKPGLLNKLKNNVLNNKQFLSQLKKFT